MKHLIGISLSLLAIGQAVAQGQPEPSLGTVTIPVLPPAKVDLKKVPPPTAVKPAVAGQTPPTVAAPRPAAIVPPPSALGRSLPPPQAQALPGLGITPGENNAFSVKAIRVGSDRNEMLYVSLTQLNKISTPFGDPQVIDSSNAVAKAVGQDLFIQPSSDKPFTVYITDGGVGQSVGLTLVPKANLPAQSFVVLTENAANKTPAIKEEVIPADYVSKFTAQLKHLVLGNTPSGFTKSRLPYAIAENQQTIFRPQFKFSGSSHDVFSYKITSKSEAPIELSEESFYSPEVRAVAFYPLAVLQKGEETFVYVVADKTQNNYMSIGDVK